jgi:hypothetical protein
VIPEVSRVALTGPAEERLVDRPHTQEPSAAELGDVDAALRGYLDI